jgi:hypothetical protein
MREWLEKYDTGSSALTEIRRSFLQRLRDDEERERDEIWVLYADSLVASGDLKTAKETIGRVSDFNKLNWGRPDDGTTDGFYMQRAYELASYGGYRQCWEVDYRLARQVAEHIEDTAKKTKVLQEITRRQAADKNCAQPSSVDVWLGYAQYLSQDKYAVELEKTLRETTQLGDKRFRPLGEAQDIYVPASVRIISEVTSIASRLADTRLRTRRLQTAFSGQPQGAQGR